VGDVNVWTNRLIGRDRELAALGSLLDEAVVDGATLLLTGEPGGPPRVRHGRRRDRTPARCPASGAHYAPVLAGFETIDQGRRVLADAMASAQARQTAGDLIWEGNIALLRHEQRALVQPSFDRLSCASARLVSIGSATSFEVRGVRREVACFTSFYLYSLTRGIPHALRARTWPRITRFDDRWRWLVTSVVPQFRRFDADTRLVNASLRHILDEARDFASTPCVLPRSPADRPRRAARPRLRHRPRPEG